MSKKYIIPVNTYVSVSKHVRDIECDSYEEYLKLLKEYEEEIWEEGYIPTNISNDFEVDGDPEVYVFQEEDIKHYEVK